MTGHERWCQGGRERGSSDMLDMQEKKSPETNPCSCNALQLAELIIATLHLSRDRLGEKRDGTKLGNLTIYFTLLPTTSYIMNTTLHDDNNVTK